MFPYKIQSHQAIPIKAVRQRFDFANDILTMIDNEGFDVGCIRFTDEAHFHSDGFVNKQNWRFWGSENPHSCETKPLHSPKLLLVLRYAAEALSAFFSCEKRSLVNVTLQFWNNLSHTASVGGSTKNRAIHARWGSTTSYRKGVPLS
ncbi:hypothetical protein AVEN_198510-1 [Araneus ventricosus]|uniref:Uncharacterized protein n=1 Tax=Araneus ventricosus TaxID=182803 RepID=A0A4Y2HK74_ARAVE|nr:hypothetical protein AVEN_198510-1 [Araneus ventricosus]